MQPPRVRFRVLHHLQLVVALRVGHQDSLPGLEHRTLNIRYIYIRGVNIQFLFDRYMLHVSMASFN